jgi:hypothetical protein
MQICDTRLSSNNMTGNQTYFSKETQFALAAVSSKIFNNPPTFIHTTITIDEDSGIYIVYSNLSVLFIFSIALNCCLTVKIEYIVVSVQLQLMKFQVL